jgi:hypothetical protein
VTCYCHFKCQLSMFCLVSRTSKLLGFQSCDHARTWRRVSKNASYTLQINVWELRRDNQNGKSRETGNIGYTRRRKTKQKHNTICVGHHTMQTNTKNVSKTWSHLHTTGSQDEPNIIFIRCYYYRSVYASVGGILVR